MSRPCSSRWAGPRLIAGLIGSDREAATTALPAGDKAPEAGVNSFVGSKAGDEREVAGVKLCWCPPGKFTMGSPPGEPERRPGEDQVEVTLTKGFWTGKYEVTQGEWKRVVGKLPGELTAELPEGDDYPVGNVNFAEAEAFCRKLTELARKSGELAGGLGVPAADRGAVGVRLPGRDHDRHLVRRQAQQQAGELPGQAVQRRPSRGRRWAGRPRSAATPPTPGACTTCTATPSSGAGTGTTPKLPGGVDPDLYAAGDATGRRPRCAGAALGRRRLALPVGLSVAVRAGAALRPHRLPGRGRQAVTDRMTEGRSGRTIRCNRRRGHAAFLRFIAH